MEEPFVVEWPFIYLSNKFVSMNILKIVCQILFDSIDFDMFDFRKHLTT